MEYVCTRLAGVRREVAEAELTVWVAARSPRAAADELARLLRRTDEPIHRELALFALRPTGNDGTVPGSGTGGGHSSPAGGLAPARGDPGTKRSGPVRLGVSVATTPRHEAAATLLQW